MQQSPPGPKEAGNAVLAAPLRRRRERIERINAEADALIHNLGTAAYSAASRREHEASSEDSVSA
jgi:hypothetical protein